MDSEPNGGVCLICGANGARHYGTVACLGCKGFFRRSILLNKVYKCIRNKACPINPQTRNGCHYCRLQKCFYVGMKTSYLQGSRQKGSDKNPRLPDVGLSPKGSPTPPFVLVNQCLAMQTNRCISLGSLGVLKKYSDNCQPSDVINYLIDVDRICDEVYDEQTIGMTVDTFSSLCTVDIDPDLAIVEPGRVAPRIDINWEPCQPFTDAFIKPAWCRLATYFFDYASFLPDLDLLDPVEKNRLVLSNSTRIMWLTLAYKTMKICDSESVLMGLGCFYPLDERAHSEKTTFNEIIKILYRDCIEPMREMNVTLAEFAVIKAIYFFSPVSNLGDRSLQIISRIRDKFVGILNEHLLNDSLCNYEAALQRITQFMGIMQVLEVSSNRFDKRMAHLAVIDKAGLRGRLTYEAHVRTE